MDQSSIIFVKVFKKCIRKPGRAGKLVHADTLVFSLEVQSVSDTNGDRRRVECFCVSADYGYGLLRL